MEMERSCYACERPLDSSMRFAIGGVNGAFFCGDHYEYDGTFVCTPCATQLMRVGMGRSKMPEMN